MNISAGPGELMPMATEMKACERLRVVERGAARLFNPAAFEPLRTVCIARTLTGDLVRGSCQ